MKLYWSTPMASLAILITAYETGMPMDLVEMDLDTWALPDGRALIDVNPKKCMPVLERDDGGIMTETAAILDWLAAQDAELRLTALAHSDAHFRIMEWMVYLATEIHKPATLTLWDIDAQAKQQIRDRVIHRFALAEQALEHSDYLVGGRFTIADIYLTVMLGGALHLMPEFDLRGVYPRLHALRQRIIARPAVQRAMQDHGQGAAAHH